MTPLYAKIARAFHMNWNLRIGHQPAEVSINGSIAYLACSCGRVFFKDEVLLARIRRP